MKRFFLLLSLLAAALTLAAACTAAGGSVQPETRLEVRYITNTIYITNREAEFLPWGIVGARIAMDRGSIRVTEVHENSPASHAGIAVNDIVSSAGGLSFESSTAMIAHIRSLQPGSTLHMQIVRNGTTLSVSATLTNFNTEEQAVLMAEAAIQAQDYARAAELIRMLSNTSDTGAKGEKLHSMLPEHYREYKLKKARPDQDIPVP